MKKAEARKKKRARKMVEDFHRQEELRKSEQKIIQINNYEIVSLPQPFASMAVRGLMKVLRWENLGDFKRGDIVVVYAENCTNLSNSILKNDDVFYTTFLNAVCMGNISYTHELPVDSYIGYVMVGEKTRNGYYGILESAVFEKPTDKLSRNLGNYNLKKAIINDISLEDESLKVPVSKSILECLEEHDESTIIFYWRQRFNNFYSTKYGFGNENGLYDVVFTNGWEERRYVQDNRDAIKYEPCREPGMRRLMAMVIYPEYLTLIRKNNGSSFDLIKKKDWILDWNCVRFKNGYIIVSEPIDGSVKFKPKAFQLPGSLESYNYLKDYLNDRLEPVHCTVEKMELNIFDTIRLNEAIQRFATASKQRGITVAKKSQSSSKIVPRQLSFNQALSKAKQMTPEEFEKYKSEYIDYLVKQQSKKYKVIPCVERLAHRDSDITEYAFMFSIKCKSGDILIVHENVNPDRSTLLFVVKQENYDKAIREIYDFLQSAEINKRSSLRDRNIEIKKAGVEHYSSINHDYFFSWSRMIKNYKEFYANGHVYTIY